MNNQRFINRELSWLEFNQRVLDQAAKLHLPLLERLKFLAISASNLDEFFMVRVGGLWMQKRSGSRIKDPSGLSPSMQLEKIRRRLDGMIQEQYKIWQDYILPELIHENIGPKSLHSLDNTHLANLENWFLELVFPLLTPLAVENDEPPYIPARRLIMLCELLDDSSKTTRQVIVPIPEQVSRRVPIVGDNSDAFIFLEDVIMRFAWHLFPGESIVAQSIFRLTRNGDIVVEDQDALDLAEEMSAMLAERQFSDCIRLEITKDTPRELTKRIRELCKAQPNDTYVLPAPLDLAALMDLSFINGYDQLKTESWLAEASPQIEPNISIFENIAKGDILLNHPFESFEPVLRLLEEAAEDPSVIAIKQVLYRTARNSRIVDALIKAAGNGKQVTVLVELKARFDEARNLVRADELVRAGAQVVYGVKGLKTHAKICLVMRKEYGRIVRYCHFGTGNYNEATAKLYTDISLLSCDNELGADASLFFNAVTGRSKLLSFRKLVPAPTAMKQRLLELIKNESYRAEQGQKAQIIAKMNSLQDVEIIEALYHAAKSGVEILLNVRGICCLKPGSRKEAKNIQVVSIVDRYLEHARIFYFHQGGHPELYIASADWMTRNLDKRIELMIPIEAPKLKARLIKILEAYFKDNQQAYSIDEDGCGRPIMIQPQQKRFRVQEQFWREARRNARSKERERMLTFEPHIP